jgi:hypothetical protein
MPVYCYVRGKNVVERVYPISSAPSSIRIKGKTYKRSIAAEHSNFKDTPGNWPRKTVMSGVHRGQAKELQQFLDKAGVPTRVHPDGEMTLESRGHRKRVHKALGYYDRSGGYGDAAPS